MHSSSVYGEEIGCKYIPAMPADKIASRLGRRDSCVKHVLFFTQNETE